MHTVYFVHCERVLNFTLQPLDSLEQVNGNERKAPRTSTTSNCRCQDTGLGIASHLNWRIIVQESTKQGDFVRLVTSMMSCMTGERRLAALAGEEVHGQ